MVDELEGIILTQKNIQFPNHFARTNKNKKGVKEIDNESITNSIKRGILWLRNQKEEYYWDTASGDTFILILKYNGDEEYYVMVTKDFYETNIPFEGVDYE